MDKRIQISVVDKIAQQTCDTVYVCGNSDYVVDFSFDSDWDEYLVKTARFITGDSRVFDVVFEGDSCEVPTISKTHVLHVGVFAGELCTTTAAKVLARKSILCDDGSPEEPAPDVYAQIMDKLNAGIGSKNLFDGRAVGSVRMKAAKEDVGYQAIALNMAKASGQNAFASGDSEASGLWAHAENGGNASGYMAHAENRSEAKGRYSHGEGDHTIAAGDSQHAQGKYNVEDAEGRYAHVVGNGNGQSRSNAHTLDWDGNAWFAGKVYVGGTSQDDATELGTPSEEQIREVVNDYLEKHPSAGSGVSEEQVQEAVDKALEQAKASGEFDGKDGAPGANGKDGYTPIKGVDYFDGKDGAPGSAGRDGTSVAITNVTESNTDGGSNVVTFSDGKTLVVKNGKTGAAGADGKDGYTPVKGVDYFDGEDGAPGADGKNYVLTEADKKEIAGMIEIPESGGGSGLPTGEAPYQQLVTDADGNAVWEDRPFYEELVEGDVLPETQIVFDPGAGMGYVFDPFSSFPTAGSTYTVTWNGTNYEVFAHEVEQEGVAMVGLGNTSVLGEMFSGIIETTDPFAMVCIPDDFAGALNGVHVLCAPLDGTESAAIRIFGTVSIVHQIDNKFIKSANNSFIVNGSAIGSLRTFGSREEEGGVSNYALGGNAFATGQGTMARGARSFATGDVTQANGDSSFASGGNSEARGDCSFAIGNGTLAIGKNSFAAGTRTIAERDNQFVIGQYNIPDEYKHYVFIVGTGGVDVRMNAHTLDWNGNAWFKGDIYVGGTSRDDGKKVATVDDIQTYVNEAILGGEW